jgi:hypothetical protein
MGWYSPRRLAFILEQKNRFTLAIESWEKSTYARSPHSQRHAGHQAACLHVDLHTGGLQVGVSYSARHPVQRFWWAERSRWLHFY